MDKEIKELCYAAFDGSIDERERGLLEQWLSESPANRAEYDRVMEECLYVRWAQEERTMDMRASKDAIRNGIARRGRLRRMRRMGGAVAAAMAAFAVVWFSWLGGNGDGDVGRIRNHATLTLSDGLQVEVGGELGQVIEKDGWRIEMGSDGVLKYESIGLHDEEEAGEWKYHKIAVERGAESRIMLADGTVVWLNSDSELEYLVSRSENVREARLRGEAYFKVHSDKDWPFTLRSGDFSMCVYGTEFNLNAYRDTIELALVEGSVGFRERADLPEKMLVPDQLALIDVGAGRSEILSDVYVREYAAWKDNDLIFRDKALESVMSVIARTYNVDVVFDNDAVRSMHFDINVPRYDDVASLFYYLEKISDVRFRFDGRTVHIDMKK